ncbi:MAG: FapA family protein [Treponema sp.]|nr:FapA family protein [Treponema sp.]
MVDFAGLQAAVKERLEFDSSVQCIETEGQNLEAAISEAANQLGVSLRYIEYEVLEKQTSFFGIGKNICKIRAYKRNRTNVEDELNDTEIIEDVEDFGANDDIDGEIFLQCRRTGVYLKVTQPIGNGEKASKPDVLYILNKRNINNFDNSILNNLLKNPGMEYIRIADFQHMPFNDTVVNVEIADQETKAFMRVTAPKTGGADLTYSEYIKILNTNGIVYGIDEDFLKKFADKPIYKDKVCVAAAKPPVDGMNSYLEYFFETEPGRVKLSENTDGKVNFKELNIIQNVLKDEKLARVHPAEKGELGFTVTGKSLPPREGKDLTVTLGKNVRFAEDGTTILADINGQVVMANGKINVESVYTIDGSVNLKTGNILFLGNVVVTGNVEEGFSVKASGNIEVCGLVDKASLTAEGDIIVRQGITGKKGEIISAGRSIWAKFIENAEVRSGSSVIVSDGILNSNIDAADRILCHGKRASIIGGRLRAAEEISAKSLGSPSGNTETICEVGMDPRKKAQLEIFIVKRDELMVEFDTININLKTLTSIKQQRGTLPEDKEQYLAELVEKRKLAIDELTNLNKEIDDLNTFLQNLPSAGRVSASAKVYNGVVIKIREVKYTVNSDFKASTFVLENGLVRAVSYIETNTDIQQKAAK